MRRGVNASAQGERLMQVPLLGLRVQEAVCRPRPPRGLRSSVARSTEHFSLQFDVSKQGLVWIRSGGGCRGWVWWSGACPGWVQCGAHVGWAQFPYWLTHSGGSGIVWLGLHVPSSIASQLQELQQMKHDILCLHLKG